MKYPESIRKLIDVFKLLPGIGEKSGERLAFSILNFEKEQIDNFILALQGVNNNIDECDICGFIRENGKCIICDDKSRDGNILCVVESSKNIYSLEKSKGFNYKYHVLGGLISPIDGKSPEDLKIDNLIKRIEEENVKEVILALKPGIEGETTTLYILKLLKDKNVLISKIAYGIPIGAEIEFLDSMTIENAIENRNIISQ